ncbi:DUF427 domain-containing protein [Sinomonas humi]|uniref:DUF427 domain-containing protein n=1 Tax=Sinomonas humi TaxID=1338436 RepID=A0A0B2AIK1_9MICC|nr:DUF427 domain-containing protein [Sinomonas humi]KHL01572.1 hypothetical protein LK10_15020 [Sinomonas humi]
MSAPRRTYRAVWNGTVLAESDRTVQVEGNQYFPPESVNTEFLRPSPHTSVCPWKGTASYYTVEAEGKTNRDAAWYYPDPSPAAAQIRGHIAFWKGVRVVEADGPDAVPGPAKGILARILGRG